MKQLKLLYVFTLLVASTIISSTAIAQLSGTYTVGGTNPDYPSVVAAANDLNAQGVSGPVTFDIRPGIYTGQVIINSISGANSTNRVTFQSSTNNPNDVTVRFGPTSSSTNYIIRLNNASYVTIRDITVTTTVTNRGRLIELRTNASYNEIENCILNGVGTSSNIAGVYATSLRGTDNTIKNNTFTGGYYGIYFRGSSSSYSNSTKNTVIEGNTFNNVGVYANYLYYQYNIRFRENTIIKTNSGTHYGMRLYYSDFAEVTDNSITINNSGTNYGIYAYYNDGGITMSNNTITLTGSGTKYGFRMYYNYGTSSNYNDIRNNVIAISNGTSTAYGLFNYYSRYQRFYNNSVNVVSTSTSSQAARFYYSNSSSYRYNIIRNNVFSNEGTGLGAYIYYVGQNNSWDYNNIYSGGTNLIQRGSPSGTYKDINA